MILNHAVCRRCCLHNKNQLLPLCTMLLHVLGGGRFGFEYSKALAVSSGTGKFRSKWADSDAVGHPVGKKTACPLLIGIYVVAGVGKGRMGEPFLCTSSSVRSVFARQNLCFSTAFLTFVCRHAVSSIDHHGLCAVLLRFKAKTRTWHTHITKLLKVFAQNQPRRPSLCHLASALVGS